MTSFWAIFCPLTLLITRKTKILRYYLDILSWRFYDFTLVYRKLYDVQYLNYMMYGSWDMECNRHNFLSFGTIFCCFTPPTTWKIKIWNNEQKMPGDIITLHMCTIKENYMIYGSWDTKRDRHNFFAILSHFLPF